MAAEISILSVARTEGPRLFPGWARRMAAYLVDLFIVAVLTFLTVMVLIYVTRDLMWARSWAIALTALGLNAGYHIVLESHARTRATVGKLLFGLHVVDTQGETIGVRQAALRFLGRLTGPVTFGFAYLVATHGGQGRTLHDRWAQTLVTVRNCFPESFSDAMVAGHRPSWTDRVSVVLATLGLVIFTGSLARVVFHDRAVTAQVREAFDRTQGLRSEIASHMTRHGRPPSILDGVRKVEIGGTDVLQNIEYEPAQGILVLTFDGAEIPGQKMLIVPLGGQPFRWMCEGGAWLLSSQMPEECRPRVPAAS